MPAYVLPQVMIVPGTVQGVEHGARIPVLAVQQLIQQAADVAGVGAHNKTSEAQHVDILDHSKQRGLCDLSPSSFDADLAFSMLA